MAEQGVSRFTNGKYVATVSPLTGIGAGYANVEITYNGRRIGDVMAMPADGAANYAKRHIAARAARS